MFLEFVLFDDKGQGTHEVESNHRFTVEEGKGAMEA
jgi:hypothetical protein